MQPETLNDFPSSLEKPQGKPIFSNEKAQVIRMNLPAGVRIPEHTSPVDTFLVIIQGSIIFSMNGVDTHAEAGQSFKFPGNTTHTVRAKENSIFLLIR